MMNRLLLSVRNISVAAVCLAAPFCADASSVAAAFAPTASASAAPDSAASLTKGFNALDYMLLRPAPERRFNEDGCFASRFFISAGAGLQTLHRSSTIIGRQGFSPRVELNAGSWITPVHGLRLSLSTGWHKIDPGVKLPFASGAVDYMMNLSSLVAGDNPRRRAELIGTAGFEGFFQRREGINSYAYGARIGLQLRLNMTPSTFFFLEPRFGIYNDRIDRHTTWQRYDWNAMMMFGFGYRMVPASLRHTVKANFAADGFRQHMFYGFAGGINLIGERNSLNDLGHHAGPAGSLFIGKMFSTVSGLRLSLAAGNAGKGVKEGTRNNILLADIDYLLNLNSAMNGYDPRRPIELNFLFGPTLAFPNNHAGRPYIGVGASLQGVLNVSDHVGLFIEPRARLFGRGFAWNSSRRFALFGSMLVGMRYTIGDYRSPITRLMNQNANREDWLKGNRFFMSVAAGVGARGATDKLFKYEKSPAVSLALGRWFSPASAWRLTLDWNYCARSPRYMDLGAAADYMLSISSLSVGWNDRRVFDLSAIAGFGVGVDHYKARNQAWFGVHAGFQARFNITPSFGLFLEPQFGFKRLPDMTHRTFSAETRLLAGVTYSLGAPSDSRRKPTPETPDLRNYVSLTAGPAMSSETIMHEHLRRVGGAFDLSVGRWVSRACALQAGFAYDVIPVGGGRKGTRVGTFHADWLLDLTQAMAYDPARRFSIIGHVGGGLAFSSREGAGEGWALRGGVRFNWRLTDRLDLIVDPTMTLWHSKMVKVLANTHQYAGTGSINMGVAWRF